MIEVFMSIICISEVIGKYYLSFVYFHFPSKICSKVSFRAVLCQSTRWHLMLKDEKMSDLALKILYSFVDLEKEENSEHFISKMFSYGTCKF